MIPLTDFYTSLAQLDADMQEVTRLYAEAKEHNTALRAEVARLTEALADLGAGVAL